MTPDFGEDRRIVPLDALEQSKRGVIAGAGPDRRVEPRHRLEIVIVDVRARLDDLLDRGFGLVAEVRREDLDRRRRRVPAKRLDHPNELVRAAVGKVVAVHRGDDDMLEAELGRGDGDMLRLHRIDRPWHSRLHVAEGAGAGAGIAEDHHGRVLLGPALADVRTGRFLADGRQVEPAHQLAGFVEAGADRGLDPDPVGLALLGRDEGGDGFAHAGADSEDAADLPPLPSPLIGSSWLISRR